MFDCDGDEKVNELEITYIDPATSSVCNRQVYCDPEDWQQRSQARLLVSSDLVNSLSEADGIWSQRFWQLHQRLEDSRSGYFFELYKVRQQLQTVRRAGLARSLSRVSASSAGQKSECQSQSSDVGGSPGQKSEDGDMLMQEEQEPKEAFAVHFFNPEHYLDSWTHEMLALSIKSFRDELQREIDLINERLTVMGGGTWRQLLMFFLKKGEDPIPLVVGLLHCIETPEYRREVINTMTNGLQDLYDALLLQFESLKEESDDMELRSEAINDLGRKQRAAIADINKQMVVSQEQLSVPGFEEPPEEEEDDTEAIAALQEKMFESKRGSVKEYALGQRDLRKRLEEWQGRLAADCDMDAIQKLEDEIKDRRRKTRTVAMRTEKQNEELDEFEERVTKMNEKITKQKEASESLQEKLAGIPNINPSTLQLKRLQRELKELDNAAKKTKAAMAEPNNRIKAMRSQLKVLYNKLGWDWDLSDSEDEDGEDKPYWRRRKIAQNGFLPFNQRDFLYEEQDFKKRRNKRLSTTMQGDQKTQLIAQMKARRQIVGGQEDFLGGQEAGPNLFGADEPSREPNDPVQGAITAYRERLGSLPGPREALLETPCWRRAQRREERALRQGELNRLLQLRESFEVQIQQCVEYFADMLPHSGSLGDLRSRLAGTLAKLHNLPEDPEAWQAEELEGELQETCETLQSMIGEAISNGDQVHHMSAAMMHSVKFSELKVQLFEVLQSELEMRAALKALGISRRREITLIGESPPMTPSARLLQPGSSNNSSARFNRGQWPPGGSIDGGSDGGFSAPGGGNLSGMSFAADELSDSMRLPLRLLAQSTPLLARRPKTDSQKRVDFGFRPDGAGEDSLENWSLFKVSKASTAASGFGDSVSTGLGLTVSSGFMDDKMRKTETKVRRHRAAVDCDFHEYMSQAHQMSEAAWRSSSEPSLLGGVKERKKSLPHLPKLVKSGSLGRTTSTGFLPRGDVLGSWERSPPRISVPSISAPSKKFGATAPNAMFTKW